LRLVARMLGLPLVEERCEEGSGPLRSNSIVLASLLVTRRHADHLAVKSVLAIQDVAVLIDLLDPGPHVPLRVVPFDPVKTADVDLHG
jgi:hypothetical protein